MVKLFSASSNLRKPSFSLHRRCYVSKPRVARLCELPWVKGTHQELPARIAAIPGMAAIRAVLLIFLSLPRVASRPWALMHNTFGAKSLDHRMRQHPPSLSILHFLPLLFLRRLLGGRFLFCGRSFLDCWFLFGFAAPPGRLFAENCLVAIGEFTVFRH